MRACFCAQVSATDAPLQQFTVSMTMGHRREQGLTSTGVGHAYVRNLPFYVKIHKRSTLVSTSGHFSVTSHSEHDRKPQTGPLANPQHPKASPLWNTHFLNALAQRRRNCGTVHLLSRPISEMQDSYRGQTAPQGPMVDHYSTLRLDPDQALTVTADPCVSTAHADYRIYSRSEIAPPSGQEAPTSNLSLTKSSTHNRLPAHKAPPTVSCHPRLPRPTVPLPYTGKHSLYRESFQVPSPHPAPSASIPGPARAGFGGGGAQRGLLRDILEVPKMYLTENQAYGGNRTVLV
ncbi:uncharacterized protein zgc:193811 isoform X2 [Esox lucius]|uniref:uncharacterized protein zgc:193811 isoform X2 n=1 Tax=Esox lucius TaxID=8010 RepID=UPI0009734651|nr:uncharacterized protein zgc:193811 isoform X2 [Esox lucius]